MAVSYQILHAQLRASLVLNPVKQIMWKPEQYLRDLDRNCDICNEIDFYDELSGTQVVGWACSNIGVTYNKELGIVNSIRFEPTVSVVLGQVVDLHGKPDLVVVFQNDEYHVQTVDCDVYYFGQKHLPYIGGLTRRGRM